MIIYLISLEKDYERRRLITSSFPIYRKNFNWIKAIDGRELLAKEFFIYANKYFKKNNKLITPSEVGCALSHIEAYRKFLKTDEEYCLIFEDDIIGNDNDIVQIEKIMQLEKPNGLVLFGGQEGLPNDYWKYILAKKTNKLYLISDFSKKFLIRAHCYLVNRDTAKKLIESHKQEFHVADHWGELLKGINMYYIDLIKHPEDLSNSNIEQERYSVYSIQHEIFNRNYIKGFFLKALNRFFNEIKRILVIMRGYKRIKK
ncbi:glycosyltransferase family 25 protein [Acinetobacter indicus]|uniref:glycosyltransferase family 25 protein n=1 Tax=Acinetobacter indicus TaxID=756892 RepID=UPI002576409C|nr:glycosyltransferase family 25 protein [Acinetobacter indicus]MDM1269001.1 glycosyltransferase family 25 protein [Acinetobacter indicus]